MKHQPANIATTLKITGLFGLALLNTGCVETTAERQPDPQAVHHAANMARRDGVSPQGASVAIADIQGVPSVISGDLTHAFEKQARARDIHLTDAKTANYLVRGYVNMSPAEGGTAFSIIWDVYDSKKRRTQRIDDLVFVKDLTPTPERIDEAALNQIAATSADDLAAVLSNMPEALAAASSPTGKSIVAAQTPDGMTRVPAVQASAPTAPQVTGIGVAAASR